MVEANKSLPFILLFFMLICCREEEPVPALSNINLSGYVQKGPFINGTAITVSELDKKLVATGKNFNTQIIDNKGSFSIKDISLKSEYVQLRADGFYFDEVKGEKSIAQLTLYALASVEDISSVNVNLLSHLTKDRILYLIKQGKTFTEAKKQSQQEVLAIFGIEKEDIAPAELLDISKEGEDNAILLAISAILQGDNSVAELSELLAEITSDIREDGKLDTEALKQELRKNAIGLKLSNIRQYVQKRYAELGAEATIPAFEQYIDSDGDAILNKEEDDTPEDFVFEAQQHVAINTTITSNEVIIIGILEEGVTMATISNGQLIKNGEMLADTLVQIKKGDKLKIQITSSSSYSTPITASLTVGTLIKSFEVVTDDYSPDEFSIPNIESAIKDTDYTTATVTIMGIQHPTPVTIDNGIIIKNGIEVNADSTTVVEGDQLAVKIHSHPEWANTVKVQLKVGSVSKELHVINKINRWTRKAVFPGKATERQISFAINGKIYVGTGGYPESSEFYEYDPATNQWTRKADFPGAPRTGAVGFSLNGKGYIGLGYYYNDSPVKDFYQYDPATNQWNRTADFPGTARGWASCFVINDRAYVGLGSNSYWASDLNDFWEYNPQSNEWKQEASFPGGARVGAVGLSVGDFGYIATGRLKGESPARDVWQYNPVTNQWKEKKDCAGGASYFGMSFTVNGKVYVGLGDYNDTGMGNFWEYDTTTDSWFFLEGLNSKILACGASLQNKGYYIKGAEVWEYTP